MTEYSTYTSTATVTFIIQVIYNAMTELFILSGLLVTFIIRVIYNLNAMAEDSTFT